MDRADHELEQSPDARDKFVVIRSISPTLKLYRYSNAGILKGAIKLVATHPPPRQDDWNI